MVKERCNSFLWPQKCYLQDGPYTILVINELNTPMNGRKSMGKWGLFYPEISGDIILLTPWPKYMAQSPTGSVMQG